MYLMIDLSGHSVDWNAMSEEDYAELRAGFCELPEVKPSWYSCPKGLLLTDDNKHLLIKHNLEFRLSEARMHGALTQALVKLQDQLAGLSAEERKGLGKAALESRGMAVQIHVPGLALMAINEVTVLDDACTDNLQEHLKEGWRILAVCPPNCQRRPDYVLGRSSGV